MKNTIYNNIINNTLERDKAAQGTDSLETARAVFNNMGVALPSGDMGEVYETLKTNDYMGWRACSAEEAQAAADRGVAAMGVSEDGIVIIAANDEDEPAVESASVMTLSNDATVSLANEMEYYAYSYGTTSGGSTSGELDAAYIRADGIYNKVEFFHSDKIWKCVNEDLIYNMSASNTVKARSTYNIWDGDPLNRDIKTYTDSELRLFYCIDPYGVAKYIKVYTEHVYSGEQPIVQAKDRFFNALFNRSPYYFAYDSDADEFYITTNTSNIDSYVSESELLFGMHNPNDFPVSMSVLDIVSRVANLLFDTNYFEIKTIERIWHTYSCVMAMGLTAVKNELRSYVVGNSYLEDALAKYGRTDLTWANNFIRYTDADVLAYDYSKNPNYTNKIVGHCADMPQFSVFIDLGEDNEWNLSDVRRLIDVYSSSEEDDDGSIHSEKTVNDWLKLYARPTVTAARRRVDIPNVCPYTGDDGITYLFTNRNNWYTSQKLSYAKSENYPDKTVYINPYAFDYIRKETGEFPVTNKGSCGELTDENGRYWMAVGPKVVNPNFSDNQMPLPQHMYLKGLLDIVLKDKQGKLWYIPAVVGGTKAHTWTNGVIQTWLEYPNGKYESATKYDLVGSVYNGTVAAEFFGDFAASAFDGLNEYTIDHIIFYDEKDNV